MVLKYVDSKMVAGKEHRSLSLIQHLLGEKGKFSLNHIQKQPILEGEKKKGRGYQKKKIIF